MSSTVARDSESMSSKESWDALNSHGSDDETKENTPLLVDDTNKANISHKTSSSRNAAPNVVKDQKERRPEPMDALQSKSKRNESRVYVLADFGKTAQKANGVEEPLANSEAEPLSINETAQGWFLDYPEWFFASAVTLREEMQAPQSLVLSNEPSRTNQSSSPKFVVDGDTYEQALDIVSSLTKPPVTGSSTNLAASWYSSASFLVQSPGPDSLDFLNTVVRRLAKDIDADLLDLSPGPLEDILHYWFHSVRDKPEIFPTPAEYLSTEKGFPRMSHFKRAFADRILHTADRKYIVDRLLTARSWKRKARGQAYEPRPLIVLLPDITAYTTRYCLEADEFLGLLYDEVKRRRQNSGTPTLIVGTAPSSRTHDEFFPQSDMGREGISHVHKQLHLDPSLVMEVVPRQWWFMPSPPGTQVNRIDWWNRLRLSLCHELNAASPDFRGVEIVDRGAPPPLPGIRAFLTHPAWTGDMTIKAFRQIVARARRMERLDAEDMLVVLARVAKNDAPFTFGGWKESPMQFAEAVSKSFQSIPDEVWWGIMSVAGFVLLWFFLYYLMLYAF
ncbi:hypothetical protein PpBr36_08006 [Pyricularia pennisetigena]|uniref:hypothetical protein n=1 Tax=Pyricularia pennisetigena TaxID=1578925 RepID=UPI0011528033|nr:hypothetical protein PpBr36_08006 [Pyricularia pennisetigena]TLS24732.1 hypothetical protein PpBr36_08006 [Pyricularia pennisetigena]